MKKRVKIILNLNTLLGNSKFTNGNYEIYIGNNLITTLSPQIFDKNGSFDSVDFEIDGNIIKN